MFFCTALSKFQEISTLNNICDGAKQIYPKGYIAGKCFVRTFFTSDLNFAKGLDDLMTCCVKGCSIQSRLNKNASYNKVLDEEIKFLKRKLNLI